jgi:hypothetical protein
MKTPRKYVANMPEEVTRLARFGLSNVEIAEFFKISISTFEMYTREIPEIYEALQQGRLYDSMKVVDSLHKQALGYVVEETTIAEHMDRNGRIRTLTSKSTKHVAPSVTAAIYLLKTRHGDKWMDIVRTEATQNLNISVKNVDFSDMSTEELLTLKKLGIKSIPEEFKRPKKIENTKTNPLIQDVRGN